MNLFDEDYPPEYEPEEPNYYMVGEERIPFDQNTEPPYDENYIWYDEKPDDVNEEDRFSIR